MRTAIVALILFILIIAGCNPPVPTPVAATAMAVTATPEIPVISNPTTGSLFAINEIGLGPDGYVSLTNFTDQPASLNGLYLCQGAQCFELLDSQVLPGKSAQVAIGLGDNLEDLVSTKANLGELQPSNGEIGLYTSANTNDPKTVLTYLQWGSTPHSNTGTAIQAGLWIEGTYAPSSDKAKRLYRTEGGLWLFEE